MKFTQTKLKNLIEQSLEMNSVGNDFLDSKYRWYANLVAHENPYYRLFYLIAKEFKPKFSVELGSYRACASGHLAYGNMDGTVVTIDVHKDNKEPPDNKSADQRATEETAAYFDNLYYINGWTWDVVDQVKAFNQPIDILYIDSWHEKQYAQRDWDDYSPLLANPALVIIDDIIAFDYFPDAKEWFQSLPGSKFLDDRIHPGIPMGFIRHAPKKKSASKKN